MDEKTVIQGGLQKLAELIGVESITLDDSATCTLSWDNTVTLTLALPPGAGTLYLSADLGPIPPGDRQAFLENLLKLNFLMLDTNGAALALDDDLRDVHLCYALDLAHFNDEAFVLLVGRMLQTAARLKQEIFSPPQLGADPVPATPIFG